MKLRSKLKKLREENLFTQKDVYTKLNVSANCYASYEQGRTEPNLEMLVKLSKIFNVSTDYLLGLEDDFGKVTVREAGLTAKDLSADEWQLVKAYREIDIFDREVILKQLRALALTVKK